MRNYILFILSAALLFGLVAEAQGQRRRDRGRLSEATQLREAEYYFSEGEKYYILEDYEKALANFERSSELDPSNSAAYYKKAQIELISEEIDLAELDAKKAIELDAANKYYYLLLVDIYSQKGDFDSAIDTYDNLIASVEGSEQYLYELAALQLFRQKYDEALEAFNRLEAHYGFSAEIALERQKIYRMQGKEKEAERELRQIVEHFPTNDNYQLVLAEFLLGMNRDKEAIEVTQGILTLYPGNARASLLLGEIYRKNGNYNEAAPYLQEAFSNYGLSVQLKIQLISQYKSLEKSSELDKMIEGLCNTMITAHPDEVNAYAIYGDFLLEKGRSDEAADIYETALELGGGNFGLWQNLILIYSRIQKFDKVISVADRAMVIYPNQAILYYFSGFAHLREEQYRTAISLLNTGKRMSSDNAGLSADFESLLGDAYNGIKDYENSDKSYEAALEANPENYIVMNNYSYYLAERGEKLERAEELSEELIRKNPDDITYLDTYAWVLYKRKKYKEAKKVAEKAVNSAKATAVHFDHYGDILFRLGDVNGAVEQWKKARELEPTLENIDKKIADKRLYEE